MISVAFIGAGAVNFGGGDGPWDHATRLERIDGVKVIAIVDPLTQKAEGVLEKRWNSAHGSMYKECKVYPSIAVMLESVKPDAAFIGTPPFFRGSMEHGNVAGLVIGLYADI